MKFLLLLVFVAILTTCQARAHRVRRESPPKFIETLPFHPEYRDMMHLHKDLLLELKVLDRAMRDFPNPILINRLPLIKDMVPKNEECEEPDMRTEVAMEPPIINLVPKNIADLVDKEDESGAPDMKNEVAKESSKTTRLPAQIEDLVEFEDESEGPDMRNVVAEEPKTTRLPDNIVDPRPVTKKVEGEKPKPTEAPVTKSQPKTTAKVEESK